MKRRSLEWACDKERNVKRSRKSPTSSKIKTSVSERSSTHPCLGRSRKRTDARPYFPSPSVRQAPAERNAESSGFNMTDDEPPFDRDVLEVAFALVQMRGRGLTSA